VTGFQQMEQAVAMEKVFAEFFHSVKGALRATPGGYTVGQEQTWGAGERVLSEAVDAGRAAVHAAMLDNINTPGVVKSLKELVGAVNVYLAKTAAADIRPLLVNSAAQFITTILATLGVAETSGGVGFGEIGGDADGGSGGGASAEEAMAPVLDLITKFRDQIRALARGGADARELMAACDELRDNGLPELGGSYDRGEKGRVTETPPLNPQP